MIKKTSEILAQAGYINGEYLGKLKDETFCQFIDQGCEGPIKNESQIYTVCLGVSNFTKCPEHHRRLN